MLCYIRLIRCSWYFAPLFVVGEDAIAVRLSVKFRSVVVVGEDANNGNTLIVKHV